MESECVTTPFGRRSLSLGVLASQIRSREIAPGASVDKWQLFKALCEIRPQLGINDRALAVLNALLSFYPKAELSKGQGLVVFPSNAQLSLRTHGMAEQTIRRHIAALVEAGLITRRDSPNGKRYAHKDRFGAIEEAFGFSLAPLLARAEEISSMAAEVCAQRVHLKRLRERMTLCRRDITKLVETAVRENVEGNWTELVERLRTILSRLPRLPSALDVQDALNDAESLRHEAIKQLEIQLKAGNQSANPSQIERHIQNTNPDSFLESECQPTDEEISANLPQGAGTPATGHERRVMPAIHGTAASMKLFPLELVLRACPQISSYAPGGQISSWRDLMTASLVVSTMLGVSSSAYHDARQSMGPETLATVMASILEKGDKINSAGGYLRDLTRRAVQGEFSAGPMLMALLRQNDAPATIRFN